jgi:hypothetical protein
MQLINDGARIATIPGYAKQRRAGLGGFSNYYPIATPELITLATSVTRNYAQATIATT